MTAATAVHGAEHEVLQAASAASSIRCISSSAIATHSLFVPPLLVGKAYTIDFPLEDVRKKEVGIWCVPRFTSCL